LQYGCQGAARLVYRYAIVYATVVECAGRGSVRQPRWDRGGANL